MKLRIISVLIAMFSLAGLSFQSLAGPPDFSICGDLAGPARGLCQAGVAIGCDSDDSPNACAQIAEQFENVTGEAPPYVEGSISPTSSFPGFCYEITDLRDPPQLASGDIVTFYLSGTDPMSGYISVHYDASSDLPNTIVGVVPSTISGITAGSYLVSVLGSDSKLKRNGFI